MLFVFQQAIRYVSPIPARDILTQKISKILERTYEIEKCKHKKKFLEGRKKAARLESCFDDIIINIFEDGKEIDH